MGPPGLRAVGDHADPWGGDSKGCSTSMDTKTVLFLHVGGNGSCETLHLEQACQLLENRLPNPCSDTDPLLRDLACKGELMPSSVGSISCVPLPSKRESRQETQQKVC